jgi:14-3-3 protein epsilon
VSMIKEIIKLLPNSPSLDSAELSVSERSCLWLCSKYLIHQHRNHFSLVKAELIHWIIHNQSNSAEETTLLYSNILSDYLTNLDVCIEQSLSEIIQLIEGILIKSTQKPENKIFYMKLTADYYKLLAELISAKNEITNLTPNPSNSNVNSNNYDKRAGEYYSAAYKLSLTNLAVNHPIRLGLVLNYSIYYYEILKDKRAACEIAKQAFDLAITKLDDLEENQYKDSTLIMQLLRDNLTLWTNQENMQR